MHATGSTASLISLSHAAKLLTPAPSRETLRYWVHHGRGGVYLQADLVAGRFLTSRDAVAKFAQKTGLKLFRNHHRTTAGA